MLHVQEIFSSIRTPLALGLAATIPFLVLELTNRPPNTTEFPLALFVAMWMLASVAVFTCRHIIRSGVSQKPLSAHNAVFVICVLALLVTATGWVGLVNDQMPCFLGVPNCD